MFRELSLHVLDIAENGIAAGANLIEIYINEDIKNNTNINSSMFSVNFLDLLQIAENEQYNAAIVQ